MIRLLIVDDERLSREEIIYIIHKSQIKIDEICTAAGADEALNALKSFNPNILITDIRMPGMLGTEIAERILKKFPNCQIIFITGYADRDYLKAAVRLNASAFIDKPIDDAELISALHNAISRLEDYSKQKKVLDEAVMSNISRLLLDKNCDNDLLNSLIIDNNLQNIFTGKYVTCILKILGDYEASRLEEILHLNFNTCAHHCFFFIKNYNAIILHILGNDLTNETLKKTVSEIFQNFVSMAFPEISCQLAVGELVDTYKNSYTSYAAAACAFESLYFYDNFSVVYYDEIPQQSSDLDQDSIYAEFRTAIMSANTSNAIGIINSLYKQFHENPTILSSKAKFFFYSLSDIIYTAAAKSHIAIYSDYTSEPLSYTMFNFDLLKQSVNYVIKLIKSFETQIILQNSQDYVNIAMEYISNNYRTPSLSITDIAKACNLNTSYLCKLFKLKTQQTLINFLNQIRVDKAKQLLSETDLTLSDIAMEVGFNDVKYFGRIFKKYEKITPSKFRFNAKIYQNRNSI